MAFDNKGLCDFRLRLGACICILVLAAGSTSFAQADLDSLDSWV